MTATLPKPDYSSGFHLRQACEFLMPLLSNQTGIYSLKSTQQLASCAKLDDLFQYHL